MTKNEIISKVKDLLLINDPSIFEEELSNFTTKLENLALDDKQIVHLLADCIEENPKDLANLIRKLGTMEQNEDYD